MTNKLNITEAVREAQKLMLSFNDPVHNIEHVVRVYDWCMKLAESYPEADKKVLRIAAFWHDVGRKNPSDKIDDHHLKSGQMVKEYLELKISNQDFIEKVVSAVENHTSSSRPKTIEGKILKDADKLAWFSVNAVPDIIEGFKDGLTAKNVNQEIVTRIINKAFITAKSGYHFCLPESKKYSEELKKDLTEALKNINPST